MRIEIAALIPAFNEELVIADTIRSILAAHMPRDRIYVINDASKDRTAEIARGLGVNVIDNPVNLGKAEGVTNALANHGLLDRHTHICFLDADTLVDERYFSMVRKRLREDAIACEKANKRDEKRGRTGRAKPIGVLCGNPKSIPHNWLTAYRAFQYFRADLIDKPAQHIMGAITVAPGCASTYSVEVLRNVVWTPDTPVEDMDVTIQAALKGYRIAYESKARVYTQDPSTLKDYIGQVKRRWFAGAWQVMHKYGLLWSGFGFRDRVHWESRVTMVFEPLLLFAGLSVGIWKPSWLAMQLLLSLAVTFCLAIAASVKERRWDIAAYSLLYPLMWLLDIYLFVTTLPHLAKGPRFKKKRDWYSPQRYSVAAAAKED